MSLSVNLRKILHFEFFFANASLKKQRPLKLDSFSLTFTTMELIYRENIHEGLMIGHINTGLRLLRQILLTGNLHLPRKPDRGNRRFYCQIYGTEKNG